MEHVNNEGQLPEIFQKSELTDITLIVEGKELHFSKYPLIAGSTVFAKMIKSSEDKSRLVLHDVLYNDLFMFLCSLHPKTFMAITDKNLEPVAKIALKFMHKGMLSRCEEYITHKFKQASESRGKIYPEFFLHLKIAEKCAMERAIQIGVSSERVEKAFFSESHESSETTGYENDKDFKELSANTKLQILSRRLRSTETQIRSISNNAPNSVP